MNIINGCNICSDSLEDIEIINHFQPIISVSENKIIAYESLCRGYCKSCNRIIPPFELFKKVKNKNELFDIDLKARHNAMRIFSELSIQNNNLFLFLNFDASLIEEGIDSPDILLDFCKKTKARPNNIIIEITESKPCSLDKLKEFVEHCREHEFLIAFDDVGTGYSNFDRISAIKPDIIKLDRSIIDNLDRDYYKKVIFRSMSRLAEKLGILLLAEGVERQEEAVYSIELGASLLQGFYYSKPVDIAPDRLPDLEEKLYNTETLYKEYKIEKIKKLKDNHSVYNKTLREILDKASTLDESEFDLLLSEYAIKCDFVESLYIINSNGTQITNSHLNHDICKIKPKVFKILKKGDSHHYEEYFYVIQENILDRFTTNTYYSHVTGMLCKTISIKFYSQNGHMYVLCMNIKEEE